MKAKLSLSFLQISKGFNIKQTLYLLLFKKSPTLVYQIPLFLQPKRKKRANNKSNPSFFHHLFASSSTKEKKKERIKSMLQEQPNKSSFRESLKALEADIQHANRLAAALPRDYGGNGYQMRLSYSPFAPFILYLIEWMDYSCTDTLPISLGLLHVLVYKAYVDGMPALSSKDKKATLREFYAVIYPWLRQLGDEFIKSADDKKGRCTEVSGQKKVDDRKRVTDKDSDRDDECGICMENCTKMVLPNCGHAICISCFHEWNVRSQSCPFCRGSLKRVSSKDLWVLTSCNDVIDMVTLAKENLWRLYLYFEKLPLLIPETHPYVSDYMI